MIFKIMEESANRGEYLELSQQFMEGGACPCLPPLCVIQLPLFTARSFPSFPAGVTKPQGCSLSPLTLLSYTIKYL